MFFPILMSTHPCTHTIPAPISRCTLDSYLCNMCPMSVGHPICCRKATAQILFLRYAPYPFQNFNSGLENTPLPHVYSGKKKAPAIADVAKTYSGVYGIRFIPPVAPFHTYIMDVAIPPFNHYARFWCRFAEHGQRGKCLVRSPILGASWSCKMGGGLSF